ncbi:protease HtpX [Acidithiobacillus sp. IBUN Pt1247-S3]|uniref:protease HtpX n=1 Tax=Acidithiobacillus sp. IBUN Pt1247-S3 TaxID=3166642 RepID=UPI0034E5B064
MKRVMLFLATNLAILVVLSISWTILSHLFGFDQASTGIQLPSLLFFSVLFGFGGSFISLLMSKWVAKRSVGARVIQQPSNSSEQWLLQTVQRQATAAGIGMPEVAIYPSPEINAFATGASRNHALVAVSSGLLQQTNADEAEAVLGHEIGHIANGDMVTLTLIQGVVNTFVIFFARIIGNLVDRVVFRNDEGNGIAYWITTILAEMVLGVLASIIVLWFSRQREFRADAAGARFAGHNKMIAALERLRALHEPSHLPKAMAAFGINGNSGMAHLFMSHPPLEERIAALRQQS